MENNNIPVWKGVLGIALMVWTLVGVIWADWAPMPWDRVLRWTAGAAALIVLIGWAITWRNQNK